MNAAAALAARVRQSHIDALQRRAAQHGDATRQVIEQRLAQLRGRALPVVASDDAPPARHQGLSPLAGLVAQLAREAPPAGELKALRDHRGTWVRLGMEHRLAQTLAQVPDNAGPLNTQRLMHHALTVMGDTSPAYLQHFMAHVEALLALDALNRPAPAPAPRKRQAGNAGRRPLP